MTATELDAFDRVNILGHYDEPRLATVADGLASAYALEPTRADKPCWLTNGIAVSQCSCFSLCARQIRDRMSTLRDHGGQINRQNDAIIQTAGGVERTVEESRRRGRQVSRRHGGMTRTTGRQRYDTPVPFHWLVVGSFNTTTTSLTVKRKRKRESGNDRAVSLTRERTGVSVEGETR